MTPRLTEHITATPEVTKHATPEPRVAKHVTITLNVKKKNVAITPRTKSRQRRILAKLISITLTLEKNA